MKTKKSFKKAVFLDRDGVVAKEIGYLHKKEDFELEKNALLGLKSIDFNQYLVFFITNQAGIAKGYYTERDFKNLDLWMRSFLLENGIKIKKTYYCPHRAEDKCLCRKPETGLLVKAEKDYKINLKESFLIGDSTCDILAGKRAGCRTILVKTGHKGKDNLYSVSPDFMAGDLLQAVKIIKNYAVKI